MKNDNVHILLVEDNKYDVIAFERAIKERTASNPIHIARDGVEALEFLRGEGGRERISQPYVVLLDLNMNRMNGFEFLEEIRKDEALQQSIVFVLTTSEADLDKTKAYNHHVAGYLSKNDAGTKFLNVFETLEAFCANVHFPSNGTDGVC